MVKWRKAPRKKSKSFLQFLLILLLLLIVFFVSFKLLDKKLMPTIIEIATTQARNKMNQVVNGSMTGMSEAYQIEAGDFYIITYDVGGKIHSLSVNTILVNEVCGRLSEDLAQAFHVMGESTIEIPIGIAFGVDSLANVGPNYSVKILPVGETIIDYESSFHAAGINQVNFQIWLDIITTVRIVNPIQSEEIVVHRKMPLVDTIIQGDVPPTYFDNSDTQTGK